MDTRSTEIQDRCCAPCALCVLFLCGLSPLSQLPLVFFFVVHFSCHLFDTIVCCGPRFLAANRWLDDAVACRQIFPASLPERDVTLLHALFKQVESVTLNVKCLVVLLSRRVITTFGSCAGDVRRCSSSMRRQCGLATTLACALRCVCVCVCVFVCVCVSVCAMLRHGWCCVP